jgi:hypothetical protein
MQPETQSIARWHLAPAVPNSGDIALVALREIQRVTFDKRARLIADGALDRIDRGGV